MIMKPVYISHRTTVRAQNVESPKEIFPNRLVKNNGTLCGLGEQALGSSLNIDVLREGDPIPVSGTGDTVLCVVGNGSYTETDVNNNTGCISTSDGRIERYAGSGEIVFYPREPFDTENQVIQGVIA